jgi:hypothetical protein
VSEFISNPVRIGLRLLGALMLMAGVGLAALLVVPGPAQVAEAMGQACVHGDPRLNDAEQCGILDVLELASAAPFLIIVGAVLVLALRRSSVRGDAPVAYTLSPEASRASDWLM